MSAIKRKTVQWAGLALTGFMAAGPGSQGAVLLVEDFDYSVGEVATQNGGSGFSAAWANGASGAANTHVTASGLSYTDGVSGVTLGDVGNALQAINSTGDSTARVFRNMTTRTESTLFVSFLVQATLGSIEDNVGLADRAYIYFSSGTGSGASTTARLGFYVSGTTHDFGGHLSNGTGTENNAYAGGQSTTGSTYLLVGKLEKTTGSGPTDDYDKFSFWVNPVLYNSTFTGSPDGQINIGGGGIAGISRLGIGYSLDNGVDAVEFDRLRMGEAIGDVVTLGIAPSEVPEPGTWLAYAGAVGLGGLWYRRRRQA